MSTVAGGWGEAAAQRRMLGSCAQMWGGGCPEIQREFETLACGITQRDPTLLRWAPRPGLVPFVAALDRAYPGHLAGVHLTGMHSGEWNWPATPSQQNTPTRARRTHAQPPAYCNSLARLLR